MSLESVDFQALIHQEITLLMTTWQQAGMVQDAIQDSASNLFNMGMIAVDQMQKEGGITPEGSSQAIPYTAEIAQRSIRFFLNGLNTAILNAHEKEIPQPEAWQLLQQVAFHVFEQSKQAIVATIGQEMTPDVQISDEQIHDWLGHTAIEALLYYLQEYEEQNGPIGGKEDVPQGVPLSSSVNEAAETPSTPSQDEKEPTPMAVLPEGIDASVAIEPKLPATETVLSAHGSHGLTPDTHYKYAAIGLLLASLPPDRHKRILAPFTPAERALISEYQDPVKVAHRLDLNRVTQCLKSFKETLSQRHYPEKNPYATMLPKLVQQLPPERVERLFAQERPLVRRYIRDVIEMTEDEPALLPPGVEECLILYLKRHFPHESVRL
jgi:hypothetical protein